MSFPTSRRWVKRRAGSRRCFGRGGLLDRHTRSQTFVNAVHRKGPPQFTTTFLPVPAELTRLLRDAGLGEIEN